MNNNTSGREGFDGATMKAQLPRQINMEYTINNIK